MNKNLKNCFGNNNDFKKIRTPRFSGFLRKQFENDALMECIENIDEFLNKSQIYKDSRTTKAGVTTLGDGKEVFIKSFNNKGFSYTLKYVFRKARSFRVWYAAQAMELANTPTPTPMAAIAEYKYGIPGNSYLIREVVPNIVSTLDFFKLMRTDELLKKSYIKQIALLLKQIHDAGIYHGDAKCSNIYVSKNPQGYNYGLWDLLSCKIFENSVPIKMRMKEINHTAWSFAEISNRNSTIENEENIRQLIIKNYEA